MGGTDAPRLFIGGAVFDGTAMHRPGLGVLVVNGRVEAIAPSAAFEGFDGMVEDTTGATLLPGLVDAHVHLSFGADDDPDESLSEVTAKALTDRLSARAGEALRGGIVALRDCGGTGGPEFAVRDRIAAGLLDGPRIRACGPIIRPGTDGFGDRVALPAASGPALLDAVARLAANGADFLNVMATEDPFDRSRAPGYTHGDLAGAVAVAWRHGKPVASNAQHAEDIAGAAAAGVASIEQGSGLEEPGAALMLEHGTVLVPCLLARRNINRAMGAAATDSERYEQAHALEERTRQACRRFARAGGKVAMGTDCGAPGTPHGGNARELALLVDAGLPPRRALQAATSIAADLLGFADTGRIARGTRADLLVVAGDPLADIGCVADRKRHRALFLQGRPVIRHEETPHRI
ncbi:MAG: amidohydrolase family protein [Azospirillaceae bacterium]